MRAPALHIQGSAYIADQAVFCDFIFDLPAGQWTCLLGASGVGKTTVLRLLADLAGDVTFDGQLKADDGHDIAPRCAYMAQDDLLLPWANVTQNITLGARLRGMVVDEQRLHHLLDAVGLRDHADKYRHELSGGQRQRVALARTLMEDKPIILLDEPFSALDARTRADMQELAHRLLKGKTVLLVTHDPAEAARLGDGIVIMPAIGARARKVQAPPTPTPRPVDDAAVLQTQATLLNLLRGAA